MNVSNPKWHNREHTMIECTVDWGDRFAHVKGEHPFIAAQDDIYDHGRDLFARLVAGEFGRIAEWGV
jgi:hypothetical protein